MMIATLALTLGFGSSSRLAGAYGMAVSTTMLLTTALLFTFFRRIVRWSFVPAAGVAGLFLLVDLAFFAANLTKLAEGGFIPLVVGAAIFIVMTSWRRGVTAIRTLTQARVVSPDAFLARLGEGRVPRVPGTLVFLTRLREPIPPALATHVDQFGALQEHVVTLTVEFEEVPRVPRGERISLRQLEGGVWHVIARFGFVEIPSLPAALSLACEKGCPVAPDDAVFMAARDEVVRNRGATGPHLPGWQRMLFAVLYRNAVHLVDRFALPPDRFVQTGRQIGL